MFPLFWHRWVLVVPTHMRVRARAHTHTHTHTHTHKSYQIFHPGSSLVSPSISFPVLKPSIWVDSPPPRWPSFPSPGFVECVFPHDVGEAAQAHGPALGLLSLREPGLRPPPQHIRSMVPRKFVHGSLFSDTSYLFLWDTIRNRCFFFFLLDLVKFHHNESES